MNVKRAAAIVVVGGALAVWLAAAATSGNRVAVDPIPMKARSLDVDAGVLASEISKLHEHLRPTAVPRRPGRNLFSFAARRPSASALPAAPTPAITEAPVTARPAATLKLLGIAEDTTSDGLVRTAILSDAGQLLLVKEGEQATPRYRVVRISADVVELTDLTEGPALRLALK